MTRVSGTPYSLPKKAREYLPEGWIIPKITVLTSQTATGGYFTWNVPGGVRPGDLAVIAGSTRNSSLPVPTAGTGAAWTTLWNFDTSSNERVLCVAKICNGTEPATYTQDPNGTGAGAYVVFRREGKPFTDFTHVGGTSDTLYYSAPITTYAGGLWLGIWNGTYNGGVSNLTWGQTTKAAFVQQSSDEFVAIAYQAIFWDHLYGYMYHNTNASGYRTAGGMSAW